jgi:hypothetical protein
MKVKEKKCKGTGKAKTFGCGNKKQIFKYGLCYNCFKDFLYNSEQGHLILSEYITRAKKKNKIEAKRVTRKIKENNRSTGYYKKQLQDLVNAIIRLIDIDENCISCNYDFQQGSRQAHAGHYFSVGAYPNNRYNFNNIFRQCSICNNYKSGNLAEYRTGLIKRYGIKYVNKLEESKHKPLNISIFDVKNMIINAKEIKKLILSGTDFTRDELNIMLNKENPVDLLNEIPF